MITECACGFTQTNHRFCNRCYQQEYHTRPEYLEKAREAGRKWRKLHPERKAKNARKWRLEHPEQYRAINQAYRIAHRDAEAATKHRRRMRLLGIAGEAYTVAEWIALKVRYGNRCLCCGRTETELAIAGLKLVPDHVIPVMKGGSNSISNIQPLCHHLRKGIAGCNEYKNDGCTDYRRIQNVSI